MKQYRTTASDNARWEGFESRPGDIFVCAPAKCGTTWTQTIVVSLLFPDGDAPGSVMELSPWIEFNDMPAEEMHAALASQTHRRVMKTHTPADGIPWFDEAYYLCVCRDGRDAFMSMVNHVARMKTIDTMNEQALRDGVPTFQKFDGDIHKFFDFWISESEADTADTAHTKFFEFIASYWEKRDQPNSLFVHFNDLKQDLGSEMRRIAEFLNIEIPDAKWPDVIARCTFEHMRENENVVGNLDQEFEGGTKGFLFKGTNGRWRDVLTDQELARYDRRLIETMPVEAARWVASGGSSL